MDFDRGAVVGLGHCTSALEIAHNLAHIGAGDLPDQAGEIDAAAAFGKVRLEIDDRLVKQNGKIAGLVSRRKIRQVALNEHHAVIR